MGLPPLVDRLRALILRARHSSSLAAQLAAVDSECCVASAGCTVPLAFLPTFGSAHDTGCDHLQSAHAKAKRRRAITHLWILRTA